MNFEGELRDLYRDMDGRAVVSLRLNRDPAGVEQLRGKPLDIKITRHVKKRTKDANSLLWACIGELAQVLRADKWEVYLLMLKRYGIYTSLALRKDAAEMFAKQWREVEVVDEFVSNGQPFVQMLCYYGSSTYNAEQFGILLDGVISEMKEVGLPTPDSKEMRRTLEQWEQRNGTKESAVN